MARYCEHYIVNYGNAWELLRDSDGCAVMYLCTDNEHVMDNVREQTAVNCQHGTWRKPGDV